jgi:Galactose oxidase-like, Early set domain
VSLIRPGITTHAFDSSQRLIDLQITDQADNVVSVTAPADPAIAAPGWYMLFITNQTDVPSIAHWIRLHR